MGGAVAVGANVFRLNSARSSNAYRSSGTGEFQIETYSRSIPNLLIDYGMTFLVLPYLLPCIAILWLVIKASAPGANAFFVQTRYGLGGKPFKMYKFRTMVPEAEELKAGLIELSDDKGPGFKIDNDPRVTKIGRLLRRTYLDELPQFFNVLKGEMALVGPRANSFEPTHYKPWQLGRLAVLPGITGTWQIAESKPKDFNLRCKMDIDYVENKSVLGDVGILLKTTLVCLQRSGT